MIGVWIEVPKPGLLASPPVAALLRRVGHRLGTDGPGDALTARRFAALLATRYAEPVHAEDADLMIRPRLGLTPGWQFDRVARMVELGHRDALATLLAAGAVRHVA